MTISTTQKLYGSSTPTDRLVENSRTSGLFMGSIGLQNQALIRLLALQYELPDSAEAEE